MARHGEAWRFTAGEAGLGQARPGGAIHRRRGMAWRGKARQGDSPQAARKEANGIKTVEVDN